MLANATQWLRMMAGDAGRARAPPLPHPPTGRPHQTVGQTVGPIETVGPTETVGQTVGPTKRLAKRLAPPGAQCSVGGSQLHYYQLGAQAGREATMHRVCVMQTDMKIGKHISARAPRPALTNEYLLHPLQ